jgi:hypothetical protein
MLQLLKENRVLPDEVNAKLQELIDWGSELRRRGFRLEIIEMYGGEFIEVSITYN